MPAARWTRATRRPDGRRHPPADELLPTFLGHAIGRWDGDTLVVDTIGTNGRARPLNGYVSGAVNSGVDTAPRLKVLKTEEPSGRKAGVKVKTVAELVEKLKTEAGVL